MYLETQIESTENSQTVANVDHATNNGAEEDGEGGAEQGSESMDSLCPSAFLCEGHVAMCVTRD
jgi:hypothetical protein